MDRKVFCKAHRVANMLLVYSIYIANYGQRMPQTCGYLLHGLQTVTVQAVPESLVTCRNGNHQQSMCCFVVLAARQGGVPKNVNNCIPVNQRNFDKRLEYILVILLKERDSDSKNTWKRVNTGVRLWIKILLQGL